MGSELTEERRRRRADLARQCLLVAAAALMYFLVRGVTQGSVERADANARSVLRLEERLGLDIERWAQDIVVDHHVLVTLSNWVYIWGHWPLIIATLYGLHRWRPAEYTLLRNALFVSGAIGLAIYVSLPVAPPRLLDGVYRDTVTELSSSYRVLQPPALVNKYAAMPSLHAGWNLLAGLALFRVSRRWWTQALALAGPVAMAIAVVTTGNHYVLDVVLGELLATIGWLVAVRWSPPEEYGETSLLRVGPPMSDRRHGPTERRSSGPPAADEDRRRRSVAAASLVPGSSGTGRAGGGAGCS